MEYANLVTELRLVSETLRLQIPVLRLRIRERWNALHSRPWWPRSKPRNMASLVNTWLRRTHDSKLSSTSPRERLDHHLRRLVATNQMNETMYTRVIDHKLSTSLDHYSSGQWEST